MPRALLTAIALFALASCAGGGGWAVLLALSLGLAAACAEDSTRPLEGEPDAEVAADMGRGRWETCCVNGVRQQCWCPERVACNYAWTCIDLDVGIPDTGQADTGLPDAGEPGTWERCCTDGLIDWCFCPEGVACNYGQYQDCGGGACVWPGGNCEG